MFFVLSVHIVPKLDILSKNSTFMWNIEIEFEPNLKDDFELKMS